MLAPLLLLAIVALVFWPPPAWGEADGAGALLFDNHCAGCHIHGGNIIRRGRTLKLSALKRQGLDNPEAIARIAAVGIGQMGGYEAALGEGGAEAVASWVWRQALEGWPNG